MTADADEAHRAWLVEQLARAAGELGVGVAGTPVFGWHDHTVGAAVVDGERTAWVKVRYDLPEWGMAETWGGDAEAEVISGVPRPQLLDARQWSDGDVTLRAELTTLLPADPVSPGMVLRHGPDLPAGWWAALRRALDVLAGHETRRECLDPGAFDSMLLAYFGVSTDLSTLSWSTAHGDLHWGNLTAPELCLIDWDLWGRAPAGYDAATLLLTSLLRPEVARRVRETFADVLDTPTGRVAQLLAAARLLHHVERGEHHDLAPALHAHGRDVIATL